MVGKKNVVFGFLYLVLTAALGPYIIVGGPAADLGSATAKKKEIVGELQTLEPAFMEPAEVAKKNTEGVLALNQWVNAREGVNAIAGNPHAHGNLESVLNILAGLALLFIGVSVAFKQLISWVFILGALLHSGMLYLRDGFGIGWAAAWFGTPLGYIGPVLILLGLLLVGLAAWAGLRAEVVRD